MSPISSRQHPLVRAFRDLAERPDAHGARLLLDGAHLVRDAHAAGLLFEHVVIAASPAERTSEVRTLADRLQQAGIDVVVATDTTFAAMSPVRTPSGIVAIARRVPYGADALCARDRPFLLAVTDVQDPGNVGALLRVGEAAGLTGAFVCGASANPFSWKALRGGMGSTLRLPIVSGMDAEAVLARLRHQGVRTVATVPQGGAEPDDVDWNGGIGLFVGAEGAGLDAALVEACDARVTIPMAPPVESLNVAVAAAIVLYAARRQRS